MENQLKKLLPYSLAKPFRDSGVGQIRWFNRSNAHI
jgi:hypothetical protein